MIRCIIFILVSIFFFLPVYAQPQNEMGAKSLTDTIKVFQLINKARRHYFSHPDSSLFYAKKALDLSRKIKYIKGETESLNIAGEAFRFLGDIPNALEMQLEALPKHRGNKNIAGEMGTLTFIGVIYTELRDYRQGLYYLLEAKKINDRTFIKGIGNFLLSNIGNVYEKLNLLDSSLWYQELAYNSPGVEYAPPLKSLILGRLGTIYSRMGHNDKALQHFHLALKHSQNIEASVNLPNLYNYLAALHYKMNNKDSAFFYARKGLIRQSTFALKQTSLEASQLLSKLHRENGNSDSTLFFNEVSMALKDSLYGPDKLRQIQLLLLKQQEQQQKIKQEEETLRNRTRTIALLAILAVFIVIAVLLYSNNIQKQKAKLKIEKAYEELKSTQAQLIQREKMASLGELTAGIAHEIQNPLNFVNNFADVNKELLAEMKQEIVAGNPQEAISIAADIEENEQKIIHHGKRADAIVKGMLQHSRASSGNKEPTNINALADEYLRLSYYGLKAKDNDFHANFTTSFDKTIGNVEVVPQDIGRVLLNLYNNAFYSVNDKKKNLDGMYEPTVSVSTKEIDNKIEISVEDNGIGIPQKALDKIYQPFFTTKPTGEGTGLGLSMSYDIIKAHGGEMRVETIEGEGAGFVIQLPTTNIR